MQCHQGQEMLLVLPDCSMPAIYGRDRMETRLGLIVDEILRKVEVGIQEEIAHRNVGLSTIVNDLLTEKDLLVVLIERQFYSKFSTGKEKFVRF